MTFKELMEKYKNGTATPEEWEQVERELEKYDALTEYMMGELPMEEETAEQPEELSKIRKSLKKRNSLLVGLAVIIACGIFAAAVKIEPAVSEAVWYDPREESLQEGCYDLEVHFAVLSELLMPGVRMEQAVITERGQGEYDLDVLRVDYADGEQDYVRGTVKRDVIEMQKGFSDYASVNIFSRGGYGFYEEPKPKGVIKDIATAKAALTDLPEYIRMEAYVSLGRDWNMDELADFWERADTETGGLGWVAVRTDMEGEQFLPLMGFNSHSSGIVFTDMNEKYPYYEIGEYDAEPKAEIWAEHFKTILRYMADHKAFYERMTEDVPVWKCEEALQYVQENGVNTYGFVYYGTPQDLLQVLNNADVEGIYVSDYMVNVPAL